MGGCRADQRMGPCAVCEWLASPARQRRGRPTAAGLHVSGQPEAVNVLLQLLCHIIVLFLYRSPLPEIKKSCISMPRERKPCSALPFAPCATRCWQHGQVEPSTSVVATMRPGMRWAAQGSHETIWLGQNRRLPGLKSGQLGCRLLHSSSGRTVTSCSASYTAAAIKAQHQV